MKKSSLHSNELRKPIQGYYIMQIISYQIVVVETGEIIYEFFAGKHANIWPLNIIAERLNAIVHRKE